MSEEEDMDELLDALERRAERLKSGATNPLRETDMFGRVPSALAKRHVTTPKPGDAIGENYEVVEHLGRGEGSEVFLVLHKGVQRRFAMKLLPQELARDEDQVQRFQDEARAASRIGHENIVFVTDFGKSSRFGFFYVMEYLDGETLSARLKREGALSVEDVVNVAACAGSALAAAHELGVVHRDVRPGNLMSHRGDAGEDTWKLLDFGLSTPVIPGDDALSLYRNPLYVAPEQADGNRVDHRADQFALAALLYHAALGRPPWPERRWTTATPDHWSEPKLSMEEITRVPSRMREALMKALSRVPGQRFSDMESFLAGLQRGSGRARLATLSPIDFQEAARAIAGQPASASVTIGATFESEVSEVSEVEEDEDYDLEDPPSVEISLDLIHASRPTLTMTFQNAARLRREWRRNLIGGALFVPTVRTLSPGTACWISIRYQPSGAEARFRGRVTAVEPQADNAPAGLSVQIDDDQLEDLHEFLQKLDLGLLAPEVVVRPIRELTDSADLSSDEAFVLDRVRMPTKVGALRGMLQSLPIDFDQVVAHLVDKGWLELEGAKGRSPRPSAELPAVGDTTHKTEFVRLTLQRADFFRSQGNFMAEIETLQLATERYEDAVFFYRIGLSRVQFLNDPAGALEAMRRAVELEPDEPRYRKALEQVQHILG